MSFWGITKWPPIEEWQLIAGSIAWAKIWSNSVFKTTQGHHKSNMLLDGSPSMSNRNCSSNFISRYRAMNGPPGTQQTQTLTNCWLNAGPSSAPLAQYLLSSGSMSCVCWVVITQKRCLTLTTLRYFSINHEDQRVFSIWNHFKCLS